jgi:aryl-alcohol dehydrogenase-like predicted oxidoreductase
MRYIKIPQTELEPSLICLGTASLGSAIDRDTSFALLDAYVAHGGNFIDTAIVYANWFPEGKSHSEKTIGQWLTERGTRDKLLIGTKGGHPDLSSMHVSRLSPQEIIQDLEASLQHLQTDVIDLYWLHRDDPRRPVAQILDTLNRQVEDGKIRYFGCSNWHVTRIHEAQAYAAQHNIRGFCANQMQWSLAKPNPDAIADPTMVIMDHSLYHHHVETGLAAIPYSSQANGFFQKLDQVPAAQLGQNIRARYDTRQNRRRYDRIKQLAARTNLSTTQIVLAYLHSQPFPTVPIVGCRTLKQLEDSLSAADAHLNTDQIAFLTRNIKSLA